MIISHMKTKKNNCIVICKELILTDTHYIVTAPGVLDAKFNVALVIDRRDVRELVCLKADTC